jgi:arginase
VNPYLIWLDAHGDFNTWETTPSGFLGGMPLAMLVGLGEQRMPQAVALRNIHQRDVLLCDGRDLDPGERDLLASSQVLHVDCFLDLLETRFPDRPLYVHFDTDLIDPRQAPAMNYPAAGGPSSEQVAALFRQIARTGRLAAASLSSWNPALDPDGSTQALCMGLLAELLT